MLGAEESKELLNPGSFSLLPRTVGVWGCQFVQVGKSARGPVLQEAERRDAAASEWKLSRSAQTVQTLSIQLWGHYPTRRRVRSNQCRDLVDEEGDQTVYHLPAQDGYAKV